MKKISLVLELVLVFGVLGISFSAEFQGTPEQALQVVRKCQEWRMFEKQREGTCRDLESIYELYINRLTKEVIEQVDLELLKSTYEKWEASKDLQVVNGLTRYTNPPNDAWRINNHWTGFIDNFAKSFFELLKEDKQQLHSGALQESSGDIMRLRVAYWKSRFIDIGLFPSTSWRYRGISTSIKDKITLIGKKIEEAKAEEERRQKEATMAEERRRDEEKRIEEQNKRQAAIEAERERLQKSYGVSGELPALYLCSNPFKYEGKTAVVRLMFVKMLEKNEGVFTLGGDCTILVSKLPSDLFTMTGQWAKLVVKVKGKTEVVSGLGTILRVPHVEYIGR